VAEKGSILKERSDLTQKKKGQLIRRKQVQEEERLLHHREGGRKNARVARGAASPRRKEGRFSRSLEGKGKTLLSHEGEKKKSPSRNLEPWAAMKKKRQVLKKND